jgi:hypothetical protein
MGHTPIPTTYVIAAELTSPKFGRAFAMGCKGPTTTDLSTLAPGPFAAFCTPKTWPLLDQAIREGRDYYYGDHGWFRRGKYYRVAKNAVQWQPTKRDLIRARPHRYLLTAVETAPDWNRDGASIIICPNSVEYMRRFGLDAQRWALQVATELADYTQRPVVIRWKASAKSRPLYMDLHGAYCVVTYTSGAAVEALRAGIPIITLAPWATTVSMGRTTLADINNLIYPQERMAFLYALAEHQWTLPEIAAGVAWKEFHR